jgi:hypothetical protein
LSWETEATNLDEFQSVARELSSSKASSLAATGQMIETEAIPVVEKYHKKRERAIKKKMKEEMVVNVNFSRPLRTTRSCRNHMPATYTFGIVIFSCVSSACLIYYLPVGVAY